MQSPCFDCLNRYGHSYIEECDTTCDYARVCLENKELKEILDKLGIAMKDENGNFRSTQDILKDIADQWQIIKS